jgi:endonuclease/exonuclease/phosphatase family metal-dependent hydrolase
VNRLRVATYNLYLGADLTVLFGVGGAELARRAAAVHRQVLRTDFPTRAEAVADLLVRERVDVVGLQEVARWSRIREGVGGGEQEEVWLDFLEVLLDALDARGAGYGAHAVVRSFGGRTRVSAEETTAEETMAVLGRNVILVRRDADLSVVDERVAHFGRTLEIRTGAPGVVLPIERSWGWVDLDLGGVRVRVVNTHVEAWDTSIRSAQRKELLEAVQARGEPELPLVLVGDLNAGPGEHGLPESYVDAWAVAGTGAGATCGQDADLAHEDCRLVRRIDYVFVRGLGVTSCQVVGDRPEDRRRGLWPSDHACVVADLTL